MNDQINSFFDLRSWQEGHKLVLLIYRVSQNFPADERFGIISQIRRAASSITANIAEGFARYHFKDKTRFYYQARGSAAEVQNFIALARDLGYLSKTDSTELLGHTEQVLQLINGMIRSIENQKSTGYKLPITNYS